MEKTARLYVKNWQKFQHFKTRRPPWIKLYRDILDDYEFSRLSIEAKAIAFQLWLLASENGQGWFPDDIEVISFRLRADINVISSALSDLIQSGFFFRADDDINVISSRYQHDAPETETETETEAGASLDSKGGQSVLNENIYKKITTSEAENGARESAHTHSQTDANTDTPQQTSQQKGAQNLGNGIDSEVSAKRLDGLLKKVATARQRDKARKAETG